MRVFLDGRTSNEMIDTDDVVPTEIEHKMPNIKDE
jgi:hypothetical protein